MTKRWCQLPLEPAARWFKLGAIARALAADLFRVYQETTIELSIEDAEDALVRMLAPEPGERKSIRHALRAIIEAGLLVPVDGGIKLLYSRETYAAHHATKVEEGGSKVSEGSGKVGEGNAKVCEGAQKVQAKPAESLELALQIEREKERKKEIDPGADAPAPKTKVQRKPNPAFDAALALIAAEYAAAFPNAPQETPAGSLVAKLLKLAGGPDAIRAPLKAYLADEFWARQGAPLASFVGKYAAFARAASGPLPAPANASPAQRRLNQDARTERQAELRARLNVVDGDLYVARLDGKDFRISALEMERNSILTELRKLKGAA